MARYLPLGNGRLLVTFDGDMNLVDFYYSASQSENHGGYPFRTGVLVNGDFAWLKRESYKNADYLDHTAIGELSFDFGGLSFSLFNMVLPYVDMFLRRVSVSNPGSEEKKVTLYFHQNFNIYSNPIGDTAFYEPDTKSVIHYKNKRYFLASTKGENNESIKSFAIGVKEFGQLEGTWKDAEDGVLSENPVAIGSVDSVVSHEITVSPNSTTEFYYYILCGLDYSSVVSKKFDFTLLKRLEQRTANFWKLWSFKRDYGLKNGMDSLFRRSLFVMRSHMNESGGIAASSDSEILKSNRDGYYYVWPRDAAITAWAFSGATHYGPARLFFNAASKGINPEGYFHHKYNMNGTVASSWIPRVIDGKANLPIQEDETSLVIWALADYHKRVNDLEYISGLHETLIKKGADFILRFRDESGLPLPSYDLWEERYGIHTYTVATAYGALMAAANFSSLLGEDSRSARYTEAALKMKDEFDRKFYSEEKGRYARAMINGKPDFTVDSALFSISRFGMMNPDDVRMVSTANSIFEKLSVRSIGGLARYEGDYYQRLKNDSSVPGNPWIITTLWGAEYYLSRGQRDKADELINWVTNHAQRSGVFSEQINPYTGEALSVSPLVWSHSEFVLTCLELNGKK